MKYAVSDVCIIGNLICMGCCGRKYKSKKEVETAIRMNTQEYDEHVDLIKFRDRAHRDSLRNGVCRNLIFNDDESQIFCSIHPAIVDAEEDLRESHCDIYHLCKAAFCFKIWDNKKKEAFIRFIKDKKLDWFEFSKGMNNDTFFEEFSEKY